MKFNLFTKKNIEEVQVSIDTIATKLEVQHKFSLLELDNKGTYIKSINCDDMGMEILKQFSDGLVEMYFTDIKTKHEYLTLLTLLHYYEPVILSFSHYTNTLGIDSLFSFEYNGQTEIEVRLPVFGYEALNMFVFFTLLQKISKVYKPNQRTIAKMRTTNTNKFNDLSRRFEFAKKLKTHEKIVINKLKTKRGKGGIR